MKIRTDFVTNSSSSSYIVSTAVKTDKAMAKIILEPNQDEVEEELFLGIRYIDQVFNEILHSKSVDEIKEIILNGYENIDDFLVLNDNAFGEFEEEMDKIKSINDIKEIVFSEEFSAGGEYMPEAVGKLIEECGLTYSEAEDEATVREKLCDLMDEENIEKAVDIIFHGYEDYMLEFTVVTTINMKDRTIKKEINSCTSAFDCCDEEYDDADYDDADYDDADYDDADYDDAEGNDGDFEINDGVLTKYTGKEETVVIPDGVTSIGDSAFEECKNLTSITIPDSVTSIGDYAFIWCSSLISITIPNSVTSIGNGMFSMCKNLTNITIPDSVTSIGYDAFSGCEKLTNITIPNGVTSIGIGAFKKCKNLTNITIPDSVASIGYDAFDNTAYYNDSSNWENNVLYINNHLIKANTSISGAYAIKDGTKTISSSAFKECSSLECITIPDSVISIGEEAFYKCENLTSITLPDSVTSIGDCAFEYCENLTDITIPDSVASIGYDAFDNTAYYNDSSNWENNVLYINNHLIKANTSISGAYAIKDGTKTISSSAFKECSSLECITIPDSVISIGDCTFEECENLTSITIPDGVTSIGCWTFSNCNSLTSITIPDSVISIGEEAFCECKKLTSITIPDSVTSIDINAFCGCEKLTSITIPDSVTSIGDSAFCGCEKLTSITIPDSVTSIGDYAFDECYDLVIHTPAGSFAEKYAKENELTFDNEVE